MGNSRKYITDDWITVVREPTISAKSQNSHTSFARVSAWTRAWMALFRELNDVTIATSVCGGWASGGKSTMYT